MAILALPGLKEQVAAFDVRDWAGRPRRRWGLHKGPPNVFTANSPWDQHYRNLPKARPGLNLPKNRLGHTTMVIGCGIHPVIAN